MYLRDTIYFPPNITQVTIEVDPAIHPESCRCTHTGHESRHIPTLHTWYKDEGAKTLNIQGVSDPEIRGKLAAKGGRSPQMRRYTFQQGMPLAIVSQWDGSDSHTHKGPRFQCDSPACHAHFDRENEMRHPKHQALPPLTDAPPEAIPGWDKPAPESLAAWSDRKEKARLQSEQERSIESARERDKNLADQIAAGVTQGVQAALELTGGKNRKK